MFVAIDFETANPCRSSACSIGVVRVEAGAIVDRQHFLIRPEPPLFSVHNVRIHGITAGDVVDAPGFGALWPRLAPLLEGQLVIAHNAPFDIGVLQQCLDQAGLPYPSLEYACTVEIARQAWWDLPRHDLKTVASRFGHAFKHHDALADAEACARIAIEVCKERKASSLRELLAAFGQTPGMLRDDGYHPPPDPLPDPTSWAYRPKLPRQGALQPRSNTIDPAHPLFGRRVVFTGTLQGLDRVEAMQLVVDRGGTYGHAVNRKTDFLVVADEVSATTSKQTAAEELIEDGVALRILTEAEFFRLL